MFGFYPEAIEKGEYLITILGSLKGHLHEPRGIHNCFMALIKKSD